MQWWFGQPILVVLEPFLDDEDASTLARVCKAHLFVCYLRASRLFKWNNPKEPLSLLSPFFVFPSDTFLRMQCAKAHLATATSRTNFVSLPMTFDTYKQRVMFTKPSSLVVSHAQTITHFKIHEYAMSICAATASAKCAMAVRRNDLPAYKRLRHKGVSFSFLFFEEAAHNCDSINADVTLLSKIIESMLVRDGLLDIYYYYAKLDCKRKKKNFYLFEHPKLFAYFFSSQFNNLFEVEELLSVGDCFYILLTQKNTLWSAYQFMFNLNMRPGTVCAALQSSKKSFLKTFMLMPGDLPLFESNKYVKKEIRNCLLFGPTKECAKDRLWQWFYYYESQKMQFECDELKKLLE